MTDYFVNHSMIQDVGTPVDGDALDMKYAKDNFIMKNKEIGNNATAM